MTESPFTFLSLYSGCGGFDLGFIQEGYRCIGAFDVDECAVRVHKRNLKSPAEVRDLSDPRRFPDGLGDIDVLLAGPPCQGFSTVGKRDPDDPRNALLLTVGTIARRIRPKVVVVENVSGILAGKQRQYWDKLLEMLNAAGYSVAELHCDATKMGVAQTRRRVVALAWNTGKELEPKITEVPGGTLRDAIENINGASNHHPNFLERGSKLVKIAKRIGPGQKLCNVRGGPRAVHTWDIPEVFGYTTEGERTLLEALLRLRRQNRVRDFGDADPVTATRLYLHLGKPVAATLRELQRKGFVRRKGKYYDLAHTFNGKFRRLRWDKPAPTVDTRFGSPRYFLHPKENRGFTVREAARIQGFPDWFAFDGAENVQYRLIGNAVPPPLARCLAFFIRDALLQ